MNMEPRKCSALEFHDVDHLPPTLIDYVRYLTRSRSLSQYFFSSPSHYRSFSHFVCGFVYTYTCKAVTVSLPPRLPPSLLSPSLAHTCPMHTRTPTTAQRLYPADEVSTTD